MKKEDKKTSRREFVNKTTAMATGIAVSPYIISSTLRSRITGANDKIRMGFIGVGNRGSQLLEMFRQNEDVEVAALCDVYKPYITRDRTSVSERILKVGRIPRMGENFGNEVKRFSDFRQLLDQQDIDAVCIATPDHWHAVQTIMAMQAGKDVYVEKPLTICLREGRRMVEAQQQSSQVIAVGLNRRGSSIYQALAKKIKEGLIGKVTTARANRISNMFPNGIGKLLPEDPPQDLDWEMWLGPRSYRAFQYNIAPYYFRWWKDYSTQMGNWGVHYMDVIRWLMGERAPVRITAFGGKYVLGDDRTIPDTMEVLFEFASGAIVKFSIHEANGGQNIQGGEVELTGSKGNLIAHQDGYKVTPSRPGQFQTWETLTEEIEVMMEGDSRHGDLNIIENSTFRLIRNFLDCIKTREEPWCSLEEGHRSTSFAHLANIALEVGESIEWDSDNEKITNNPEANELLDYEYRSPWKV
jgi:predicted dehydrogenase